MGTGSWVDGTRVRMIEMSSPDEMSTRVAQIKKVIALMAYFLLSDH